MTWVVYTISHLGGQGKFLEVTETKDKAEQKANKWWKAFDSGEKAKPQDYAGIAWDTVADFDEWKSPEEM